MIHLYSDIIVRNRYSQQGTILRLASQKQIVTQPDTEWYLCKYEILYLRNILNPKRNMRKTTNSQSKHHLF